MPKTTKRPRRVGDNAAKCTYRVVWSEEDGEFVGLCTEFPSLSWLAADQEKTLQGVVALVRDVVRDLHADGEQVPTPIATKRYNGVFKVRIPPHVHRELAIEAAESRVSLNRLVSAKLFHG